MVGASLVMLGIALHMTILSYQSANASEQKKLRELEDRHYIRYRNRLLFELFLIYPCYKIEVDLII